MYNWFIANPDGTDREFVAEVCQRHGIHRTTAYSDLAVVKSLLRCSALPLATSIVSECCNLEREMGDLARYFDYKAFGRDLFMYDYSMGANGNVFRVV